MCISVVKTKADLEVYIQLGCGQCFQWIIWGRFFLLIFDDDDDDDDDDTFLKNMVCMFLDIYIFEKSYIVHNMTDFEKHRISL